MLARAADRDAGKLGRATFNLDLVQPTSELRCVNAGASGNAATKPAINRMRDQYEAKGKPMHQRGVVVAAVAAFTAAMAYAQFPVENMIADRVIQKYQTATCEQLWQEKAQGQGKPKPEMEQRAIAALKGDPQMRQAFFNKVSAPIVSKMFECGMIP